jgi:hypothetical protein
MRTAARLRCQNASDPSPRWNVKRVVDKVGVGCIESAPMLGSVLSASFAAAAWPHSRSRGVWVSIGWLCVKRAASALLLCCLFVVVQATCAAGKVCAGPCCVSRSIGSAREFGGGRSALLRACAQTACTAGETRQQGESRKVSGWRFWKPGVGSLMGGRQGWLRGWRMKGRCLPGDARQGVVFQRPIWGMW